MKKVLVCSIIGIIFFFGCSVQSANAQNANNERRIIGTWIDDENVTWVINSNGSITMNSRTLSYGITDTRMVIVGWGGNLNFRIYDFSMSSDGKTIIIMQIFPNPVLAGGNAYWLKKQ